MLRGHCLYKNVCLSTLMSIIFTPCQRMLDAFCISCLLSIIIMLLTLAIYKLAEILYMYIYMQCICSRTCA